MLAALLLSSALVLDQAPGGGAYPTPPTERVIQVYPVTPDTPQRLPSLRMTAQQPGSQPKPMPSATPGTQPMPPASPAMPPATEMKPLEMPAEEPKAEDAEEEKAPQKYFLEEAIKDTALGNLLSEKGITIYGWTAMSYNVSSASNTNLPRTLDDIANEFQLNQNWLHIEKTLDTKKKEFQLGFLTDLIIPGTDYRFSLPRGLFNQQLTENDGGPNIYGFDPFQFYVQAFLPNVGPEGTTVRLGRFNTHIGYEVVQQVDTPFVSRSFLFQYNPFTHTGVWATTPLSDTWSVSNGLATGSDTFIDPANRLTYLGQIKYAPPEGKTTVAFNTVLSNTTFYTTENFPFYNVYNLLVTYKANDKLNFVADATYSHVDDVPNIGFTDWYGVAGYAFYNFTDKVTGIVRAEAFADTDGFRTGFEGTYTEVTLGVAYKPCPGLIIRPSVRWDANSETPAFEGSKDLYTGTMECIIRW